MFDTNLNETIYNSSHMIGVSEVGSNVREITLLALLDEAGCLTNNDGTRIPTQEINEITDIAIVWKYDNYGDINVTQIYNHETGEVYWEDNFDEVDTPSGRDWSLNDEILYCSLLMWAEVEQTIA